MNDTSDDEHAVSIDTAVPVTPSTYDTLPAAVLLAVPVEPKSCPFSRSVPSRSA